MRRSVEPEPGGAPAGWEGLARRLFFHPLSYDDPQSFSSLKRFLEELDSSYATRGNRLFYSP